jgi:tetratricopeptide (TPR) repeat protein
MPFDTYFFRLPLAKAQWQSLVHQAAVRLQGGPLQGGIDLSPSSGPGIGKSAGALADSSKDVISAQVLSGEHTVSALRPELQKLEGIEAANLGVNVANTAILAFALYKLHSKLGEATAHLKQLERLTLENRILAERQTETSQAILKALHESRRVEASQLIDQGERNVEAGLIDEAVDRFKKALEYDNTDPVAWMNLAVLYARNSQTDNADDAFKKSLTFSRGVSGELNRSVKRSYARFLGAAGRLEDGIRMLDDLGESAEDDDFCERATYQLLAGHKDDARKLLAALLRREHSYVLRLAVDPRIRGSIRNLLDKWLAQAHSHFLTWLKQSLQAVTELAANLRTCGAPSDLIAQAEALEKRLQELLISKEIASSAEVGQEVAQLKAAFERHLAEAREAIGRREAARQEIIDLWSQYDAVRAKSGDTQKEAKLTEISNRIQEIIKKYGFQCKPPASDSASFGCVGCLSFVAALILAFVVGIAAESGLLGFLIFVGVLAGPLIFWSYRAKEIRAGKRQEAMSLLQRDITRPGWTTIQFPATLTPYGPRTHTA